MRTIAAPIAALVLATGCGGGDEARTPVATASAFYEAIERGDGEAACALASERYIKQLEYDNPSCEALFDSGDQSDLGQGTRRIEELGERDETALVHVRLGGSRRLELFTCMIEDAGEWKVHTINPRQAPSPCRGGSAGPDQASAGGSHGESDLEPEIPAGADLCPDLKLGDTYVALRVIAEHVSCHDTAAVIKGELEGSPPEGWSCEREGRPSFGLTTCTKGRAVIRFNDE